MSNVLFALNAMIAAQASHIAEHDAKMESLEKAEAAKAAEKVEKAARRAAKKTAKSAASVPTATPEVSVESGIPAPKKGVQGSDASGFVTFRGERYAGIEGFTPGTAGADHEVRKMRLHMVSLASSMLTESDEHGKMAAQYERKAFEASRATSLVALLVGDVGDDEASVLAEMAIEDRAMAEYKLRLAEQILSELESADDSALAERYRNAGSSELSTETVIAFSNGSFPGASLDAKGVPVFEKSGETVVPLSLDPSEADKRRARCRAALDAAQAANSAPVETPAAIVNVSEADREAARAAELAALLAESAADDTDQIAEYLE